MRPRWARAPQIPAGKGAEGSPATHAPGSGAEARRLGLQTLAAHGCRPQAIPKRQRTRVSELVTKGSESNLGFVFCRHGFCSPVTRDWQCSPRSRARRDGEAWSFAWPFLRAADPPQPCRRLVRRRRHPRRVDRGAATPPNPCAHFEGPHRVSAIACARVRSGATRFNRVARVVRAHYRDAHPPRLTRHMPLLFAHADVMAMVVEASTRRGRSGRTRARRTTTPRRACRSSASHGATQQISSWTARPAAPPS